MMMSPANNASGVASFSLSRETAMPANVDIGTMLTRKLGHNTAAMPRNGTEIIAGRIAKRLEVVVADALQLGSCRRRVNANYH